jgi:hypothetical protein
VLHISCIHCDIIILQLARKRSELPLNTRFKAIAEELAGFFLDHVIPVTGEFHNSD